MNSTPPPPAFPPPPQGLNYIVAIKPSLTFIIIGTTFSSFLIPLLVALFFFATPHTRLTTVFLLNVVSVVVGIALGAWNNYMEVHAILSPLDPLAQPVYLSFNIIYALLPLVVETILVMRLSAFFPPKSTPRFKLFMVFSFPVTIKILRIVVLSMFTHLWARDTKNVGNPITAGSQTWSQTPYVKIEWVSQLLDNSYSSGVFLWHLWRHRVLQKTGSGQSAQSFRKRLRTLFWIALSNFVFPVIFNIAQLIIVFQDSDFFLGTYVLMVNTYVSIISVVFATVWAGTNQKKPGGARLGSTDSSSGFPAWRTPGRRGQLSTTSTGSMETALKDGGNVEGKHDRTLVKNKTPLHIFVEHSKHEEQV